MRTHPRTLLMLVLAILLGLLSATPGVAESPNKPRFEAGTQPGARAAPLGHGFTMIRANGDRASEMGFDWIQSYYPPYSPQPAKVLTRVEARAFDLADLEGFRWRLAMLADWNGQSIDAYEIGNEVNLYNEWGLAPSAIDYVRLLREAQLVLRQHDPTAKIISAGLSTTGRVPGIWDGHQGHSGVAQDEREFLKEFIAAGGLQYVDGIGYHPMGFRADYSAAPDVSGGKPDTDCSNGLCFRSAEKFYEILRDSGHADARIWATEVGWIVTPPTFCENYPSWEGRLWQAVSPEKQATNLVGAFQYAQMNWPWMEALFVFNLDINTIGYYDTCEQMRYYSVSGRPAEAALAAMPKTLPKLYLPMVHR